MPSRRSRHKTESQLRGSAQIEERGGDLVQVSPDVHGANPGARNALIREREPCTMLPAARPQQGTVRTLGLLRVNPHGDGRSKPHWKA